MKLARAGAAWVADGVVGRRRFGQASQHGCFGHRHVLQGLAEIHLRGRSKAVGALAQKNLVHVDLKDLLLGEHVFQLEGEQDFVDLAHVAFFSREVDVARHLHGDGGGALAFGLSQVGQRGTHHADVVHPVVFKEAGVFDGQHGVGHDRRNLGDGQQVAAFFTKFAHQHAVGREHAQGQFGPVVGQIGDVGQVGEGHGPTSNSSAATAATAKLVSATTPRARVWAQPCLAGRGAVGEASLGAGMKGLGTALIIKTQVWQIAQNFAAVCLATVPNR